MAQSRRVIYGSRGENAFEKLIAAPLQESLIVSRLSIFVSHRGEVVSYKRSQVLIRRRIVFSRKYTISYSILFIPRRTHNRYCGNKFRFIHTRALLYIIFFDRIQHMLADTYICLSPGEGEYFLLGRK